MRTPMADFSALLNLASATASIGDRMCECGHKRSEHSDHGDRGCLADVGAPSEPNPRGCNCEKFARSRAQ